MHLAYSAMFFCVDRGDCAAFLGRLTVSANAHTFRKVLYCAVRERSGEMTQQY